MILMLIGVLNLSGMEVGNYVRKTAECQNITYLRLFKRKDWKFEPVGMNFV